MEIEYQEITRKKVYLSDKEVKKIAREVLSSFYKIPLDAFLKNGKIVENVEYYGSHSWFKLETIRDNPTKKELIILDIMNELAP